jgi:hypothetical protein
MITPPAIFRHFFAESLLVECNGGTENRPSKIERPLANIPQMPTKTLTYDSCLSGASQNASCDCSAKANQ